MSAAMFPTLARSRVLHVVDSTRTLKVKVLLPVPSTGTLYGMGSLRDRTRALAHEDAQSELPSGILLQVVPLELARGS